MPIIVSLALVPTHHQPPTRPCAPYPYPTQPNPTEREQYVVASSVDPTHPPVLPNVFRSLKYLSHCCWKTKKSPPSFAASAPFLRPPRFFCMEMYLVFFFCWFASFFQVRSMYISSVRWSSKKKSAIKKERSSFAIYLISTFGSLPGVWCVYLLVNRHH